MRPGRHLVVFCAALLTLVAPLAAQPAGTERDLTGAEYARPDLLNPDNVTPQALHFADRPE
jgi:hypothetical protein